MDSLDLSHLLSKAIDATKKAKVAFNWANRAVAVALVETKPNEQNHRWPPEVGMGHSLDASFRARPVSWTGRRTDFLDVLKGAGEAAGEDDQSEASCTLGLPPHQHCKLNSPRCSAMRESASVRACRAAQPPGALKQLAVTSCPRRGRCPMQETPTQRRFSCF